MTKASTYRDKSADELADELVKLKKEQFNLRFQRASGQLEKTDRVRFVRRDIARLRTIIGQKTTGTEPKATAKAAPKAKTPKAEKTTAKAATKKAAPKAKSPKAKE